MENPVNSFVNYARKVLDTDRNGVINFKDYIALFPNSAVAIAVMFVDLLVLVAEYRVWDVGYAITGDTYKAVGFVLVSAVPFYLGQLFWLYPRANTLQRAIGAGFVLGGLATSAAFGLADLTLAYEVNQIVSIVIYMTLAYIGSALLYVLKDNTIKANRLKAEMRGKAEEERHYQKTLRDVLADLRETQRLEKELAAEFGEDVVSERLSALRGSQKTRSNFNATVKSDPVHAYNAETPLEGKVNPQSGTER